MDAEGGELNILGCADDKEGQNSEDVESLKRGFDVIDTDDDEEYSDSDDDVIVRTRDGLYDPLDEKSFIGLLFEHPNIEAVASRLERDSELVEVLENILKSLKKENITSSNADDFSKMVKQVLENKFFLTELYEESQDPFCLAIVRTCGLRTQQRVDTTQGVEERMALIRDDTYFDRASVGRTSELVVRGVLSILIAYCISDDELRRMSRRIGKSAPEVWVTGGRQSTDAVSNDD